MAQKITPNQFDLQGQGISINYSTSGIAGKPLTTQDVRALAAVPA